MTQFLFIDESGNFRFDPKGSKVFVLTSIAAARPFVVSNSLADLRYELIQSGFDRDRFHACEDDYATQQRVCNVIRSARGSFRSDSVVVRKCRTNPTIRRPIDLYSMALGHLLKYVFRGLAPGQDFVVITDSLPMSHQRSQRAINAALKKNLNRIVTAGHRYQVLNHPSASSPVLQVADYFAWGIARKWARGHNGVYAALEPLIFSEFDIFKYGDVEYY